MARRLFFALPAALFVAFTVALTNSPSYAQDYGQKSALLNPGMSESEVVKIVGYPPSKVELRTCGGATREGPWSCKTYTFDNLFQTMTVRFAEVRGRWLVNSWSVHP